MRKKIHMNQYVHTHAHKHAYSSTVACAHILTAYVYFAVSPSKHFHFCWYQHAHMTDGYIFSTEKNPQITTACDTLSETNSKCYNYFLSGNPLF